MYEQVGELTNDICAPKPAKDPFSDRLAWFKMLGRWVELRWS